MTTHVQIGAESPRKDYIASGAQTVFGFDFAVFEPENVEVRIDGAVAASGFVTNVNADGRGNVVFAAAPASNARVTLIRRLTIRRQSDFQEGGALRAKTLNDELDFQTAAIQQVGYEVGRALRQDDSDPSGIDMRLPPKATRAGHALGFDANGRPVALATPEVALELPVAVAQGGTGGTDAAAARANLGLGAAALLDAVQAFTRAQRYAPANLIDAPTIDWDLDLAPMARVTLAGSRTMAAPSHQRDGGMFALEVAQDGTGGRSLAWNAAFEFGADGVPILPAGAGRIAIFVFHSNATALRCVGRWNN
jgi:hypothetical protein